MMEWCVEAMPDRMMLLDDDDIFFPFIFLFEHEADLMHFRLAWSEVFAEAERAHDEFLEAVRSLVTLPMTLGR